MSEPTKRKKPARARLSTPRVNAKPNSRLDSARAMAVDILCSVDVEDTYANLLLNKRLRSSVLSDSDAGFLTELVNGTLRERLFYDAVIELASQRSSSTIDPVTLNILRLGAHQLLTLHTGAHAAVNESVELQRVMGKSSATGFVNGVLRTLSRSSREEWMQELLEDAPDEDTQLSIRFSHPSWIVRAFREALNREGRESELEQLLAANNQNPKVNLVLLPGATLGLERSEALIGEQILEPTGPSPLGFVLGKGNPMALLRDEKLAVADTLRVQDQGSQIAALSLVHAQVLTGSETEQWLDLCAGPGGKTAILAAAAAAADHPVSVRAVEKSEHRTELVRQAVRANKTVVSTLTADGTQEEAFGGQTFDRILVDAPCTGLGALRRRPESRTRRQLSDLAGLTKLQSDLLEHAVAHLKPGGVVSYVTCSPHTAETRAIVDRTLHRHNELEELNAREVIHSFARAPLELSDRSLSAQLWPHLHHTDAMFIALLRRRVES